MEIVQPGGSTSGGAINVVTEVVIAVQVGSDVTIDETQLTHFATMTNIVLVMRNQIPQTLGVTYTEAADTITIPNADAGESYQITYAYTVI